MKEWKKIFKSIFPPLLLSWSDLYSLHFNNNNNNTSSIKIIISGAWDELVLHDSLIIRCDDKKEVKKNNRGWGNTRQWQWCGVVKKKKVNRWVENACLRVINKIWISIFIYYAGDVTTTTTAAQTEYLTGYWWIMITYGMRQISSFPYIIHTHSLTYVS